MKFAMSFPLVVVSIVAVGASKAGDPVKSGLSIGDFVAPFDVDDVTGPNKGKTLCYRWRYGGSPVVCVFARQTSETLASLVKKIDEKIGENGKLKAFVVLLASDSDKASSALKELASKHQIKHVPLTMLGELEGPASYELSKSADVTVLMWVNQKVAVNHAYKGSLSDKDIEAIVADIPKILK